jgi:hypothetical protein
MNDWQFGTPDSKYVKWFVAEVRYVWKGRKPFTKQTFAKWLPLEKRWVGYNGHRLNVLRWKETDSIKEL